MKFGRGWVVVLLAVGLAAVRQAPAEHQATNPDGTGEATLSLQGVRVDGVDGGKRVAVDLGGTPGRVRYFSLPRPARLVMDVDGKLPGGDGREQRINIQDDVVSHVRAARYKSWLRVVIDLSSELPVTGVHAEGNGLVADFGSPGTASAASGKPKDADVAASGTPPPPAGPVVEQPKDKPADQVPPAETTVAAAQPSPEPAKPAASKPSKADKKRAKAKAEKPAAEATPEKPAVSEPTAELAGAKPTPLPPSAPEPTVTTAIAPEPPAKVDEQPAKPARKGKAAEAPKPEVADSLPMDAPLFLASATALPAPGGKGKDKDAKSFVMPAVWRGTKISLDFKDADIQNVLRVLADVSNLNIIATDDVKGKVTLHLAEVPWDQALNLVLHTNRLEATQEGNVVRVSTVARLKEEREALRAAVEAQTDLEPLKIAYYRVNYARADEALIDKVKGVLTDRGSVTFDDRTNTIIIRDIQNGIGDAEQLIRELDVQSPQVLIEANIVEATEDFARGLGVQWGYGYKAGPGTGNPTGMNFPGTVGLGGSGIGTGSNGLPFLADFPVPGNFASGFGAGSGSALDLALGSLDGTNTLTARLTALENEGKGRVISRPRVVTMNNVAATIQSLTILRVKLPSTGTVINTGQGGQAGGGSTATEKINTGITLVVTPQVSSDGFVLMNIYAKSSQPDFTRTVDNIPNEISREANSNVLIHTGETVVLGGIFRHTGDDRETGIPYLRSVPGLGWLFKNNLTTKHQEELLVFLTPRIIETGNATLPPSNRLWQDRQKNG